MSIDLVVSCAPVRRIQSESTYSAKDYEVCLVSEGRLDPYSFPSWKVGFDTEPSKAALQKLQRQLGLYGTTTYPLKVSTKPTMDESNVFTVFFAIPVSCEDRVTSKGAGFHNLSEVLENYDKSYTLEEGHRAIVNALDQWLRERHTIPFVNLDLVFLCSRENEGVGGLVKAIIDNPIYNSHVQPPEDKLVISLNNPIFVMNSTHDLDATTA